MAALLRQRERRGWSWYDLSAASGVPTSTLQFWNRRLRDVPDPGDAVNFARVAIVEDSPTSRSKTSMEVILRSGHRVRLRKGFDPELFRTVVAALEREC